MTTQLSFTKFENELLPEFRQKTATAESTEDVKKVYSKTMEKLFLQAFSGTISLDFGDILLTPNQDTHFFLADKIRNNSEINTIWHSSDLPNVVSRFTETAIKRYHHLEKNLNKTEAKIRN